MQAHEHQHGQEYEHEFDERARSQESADATAPAALPHLFHAASTGRTDVVGPTGMGTLQRTVGNSAVRSMLQREPEEEQPRQRSSVHDVVSSGGVPLDAETRTDMEGRLGADFSDVHVHTDSAAHDSAREVGARAYTVGSDIVFQRDAYDPSSHDGRTTLAHELTHVVQQRSGPVEGTEAPGGIRVSDPSDRFEQEASARAEQVMSQPSPASPAQPATPTAVSTTTAAVQRQAEEGEDEEPADVQGAFVQRAAKGGEEEEEEQPPPE
ncbi:DUF4157 domain-containing protein [Streptomyces sp. N2-109]|uniref:DUF4157 domain-containing protein n=1 Tax=Streptomyces gossypii TaxID=2883101 RepID=A0ABT2K2Z0_9ACTN|nr:DUF4157 domain-containing protein [Streptomyces gossypii]MCT2593905.1 DUF4157 domain-containing protein [Streptomyces gossypii]